MELLNIDRPLLGEIAGGDVRAFEELYERHSAVLYGLLVRILHDPEDASEVLQEAFIQVWNRAAGYDNSRGSEIAWLVAIARSRGIDRIRSRKVRTQRELDAGREISIHAPHVNTVRTDQQAIQSQIQVRVRGALLELPEAQRKALELAYFEGMTQTEIAEKLSEPLGTVKTRMQLGMRKLRDKLGDV